MCLLLPAAGSLPTPPLRALQLASTDRSIVVYGLYSVQYGLLVLASSWLLGRKTMEVDPLDAYMAELTASSGSPVQVFHPINMRCESEPKLSFMIDI